MGNNISTLYVFRGPAHPENNNLGSGNSIFETLRAVNNSTDNNRSPQTDSNLGATASHSSSPYDDLLHNQTKGVDADPRPSAITGNASFERKNTLAYIVGINDQGSNIPGAAAYFPKNNVNSELIDFDVVSTQGVGFAEDNNNAAGPSGLKASADTLAPPPYGASDYAETLGNYIEHTLIPNVNQKGKAPLLLRPLAALASWFGYQGFGQSNCLSCAASVADTLQEGTLYQAFPTQRGGRPSDFATLQKAIDAGNVTRLDLVERLAYHLTVSGDLNIVLTIKRPPSLWRRVFHWVDGHACNIIKTGNAIFLVDAQKKKFTLCDIIRDHELSIERADVLRANLAAKITPELTRFVGAVDSTDGALQLYDVGWEKRDPNS